MNDYLKVFTEPVYSYVKPQFGWKRHFSGRWMYFDQFVVVYDRKYHGLYSEVHDRKNRQVIARSNNVEVLQSICDALNGYN